MGLTVEGVGFWFRVSGFGFRVRVSGLGLGADLTGGTLACALAGPVSEDAANQTQVALNSLRACKPKAEKLKTVPMILKACWSGNRV